MSILDSTFPNGNYNTLQKKYPEDLLDLNMVLKECLKKAQAGVDDLQLIIRCESLPRIRAVYDEMVKLFENLLGTILNHAPETSRLFLYVDCEEDSNDVIDMTLEEGFKRYTIKFHTNVTTNDSWKLVNSQALINCRQILSNHNGNLAVNEISKTGCLFSVSLPGKID
jgi:light-regulated signal transduction histidine kinase (bacteriophytochrome)